MTAEEAVMMYRPRAYSYLGAWSGATWYIYDGLLNKIIGEGNTQEEAWHNAWIKVCKGDPEYKGPFVLKGDNTNGSSS